MDAERWAVLRAHVEAALALPPAERSLYSAREVSDPELRAELDELLAFEDEASSILSIDGWDHRGFATLHEGSLEGERLGNYRLIEEIGRGGMGTVYLAERADGTYEQKVAVKILQESIFTPGLVARFEEERRILARLAHPGIARLLDGGVTPDGRPYLVLEYVAGLSIDRYCAEHKLDANACLRLFLRVAEAVQSAHQQLVLHLDLKPANILINEKGEPRLLDFGIARVLAESEGGTLQPEETIRLLTPRYASPEQLRGEPLGVASDVFSLATLLYRLLTGSLPYPVEGSSALQAARLISTVDAVIPSKAMPPARRHELTGDLDTILMKALRKDPRRRYPTVAAFAEDVTRHLEQRPVLAHAGSLSYRVGKFLRRNRTAVLAGAVAATLLTVTTSLAIRSAIRDERSRKVAESRLKDVQDIAHSYVFDLDSMLEDIPGTLHVRQFALANAKKYLDALYTETQDNETLAHDVVEGYTEIGRVQATPGQPSMGDPVGAEASFRRALEIERRLFALHPDDLVQRRRVVRQLQQYLGVLAYTGDPVGEDKVLEEAWTLGQPLLITPEKTKRYLLMSVIAYERALVRCGNGDDWNLGDPVGAVAWLDQAQTLIDRYRAEVPKEQWEDLARAMAERVFIARGTVLIRTNRAPEAIQAFRTALGLANVTGKGQLEDNARRELQGFLTDLLLLQGDVAGAQASAVEPRGKDVHEKIFDHQLTRDDADELVLRGRLDLAEGKSALGRKEIAEGIKALEDVYKAVPSDIEMGSGLAWVNFTLGEERGLPVAERRRYYERARSMAESYVSTHPGVLSPRMLMGRCDLGLARLAPPQERRSLASQAVGEFTRVLTAHPVQPEAQALLTQANMMGQIGGTIK